ncbi:hypothetical protein ABPG72_013863 [Tetrahymena utriculariae]
MQRLLNKAFKQTPSSLVSKQVNNFAVIYGPLADVKFDLEHLNKQSSKIQQFINIYRKHGHQFASIDPLNLVSRSLEFINPLDFGIKYTENYQKDIDKDSSYISTLPEAQEVAQLESYLKRVYQDTVGIEFEHVNDPAERTWLYYNFERHQLTELTSFEKVNIHSLLSQTEALDHFLHKKFQTFKRYAGEGAESSIVGLKTILAKASEMGVEDAVIGMPHRGRLNVLCNLLDYPVADLLRKISGHPDLPNELYNYIDDVVSHIAVSKKGKLYPGTGCKERPINVSLLHNPSHLEAVNPVSMGKARAKMDEKNKAEVLNIQLHGDAAFSAQGVVYESFALGKVPKFSVGGTIHMIVNNQIGFTTNPIDGRGGFYCSDIAKAFDTPILHVNSDDPEAIHRVCKFAVEYRQRFQKDILIDVIGYRRYGHNELDEPEFTQPHMYNHIKNTQKTCPQLYDSKLIESKIVKEGTYQKIREKTFAYCEIEFEKIPSIKKTVEEYKADKHNSASAFRKNWKNMDFSQYGENSRSTGYNADILRQLARQSVVLPNGFQVHNRLQKNFIQSRLKAVENNSLDWATCEALAAMTLLEEGHTIRFTGEDVERGTFSQRHWVFTDQITHKHWNPIKELYEGFNKGKLYVYNSPLSEIGALSYEYGYSLESERIFSIWEAQFGDFNNSAQVAIDTFFTCSEHKWARQSSLTLLLPHGMDGAGPEHSSCRMERFLQMANTDGIDRNLTYAGYNPNRSPSKIEDQSFYMNHQDVNFQLINPTTPANYFHALRRQMHRNYRKPLIVVGPKTLIRHQQAKSTFEEMGEQTKFKEIIQRLEVNHKTKNIIIMTGKFQYDVYNQIEQAKKQDTTALVVLEELLPFPEEQLQNILSKADAHHANIYWVQEEHINSGAYVYSEPHIARVIRQLKFKNQKITYVGRKGSPAPATGRVKDHAQELKQIHAYIEKIISQ